MTERSHACVSTAVIQSVFMVSSAGILILTILFSQVFFFYLFMTRRLSLESWNPTAVFKMYGIKCAYEVLQSLLQPEARACRANWFYKQLFDELVNIKDLRYVGKVLSGEQWSSKGWERAAEQYQLLSAVDTKKAAFPILKSTNTGKEETYYVTISCRENVTNPKTITNVVTHQFLCIWICRRSLVTKTVQNTWTALKQH